MWARLRPLQRRLLFTRSSSGRGSTPSSAAYASRLLISLPPAPAAAPAAPAAAPAAAAPAAPTGAGGSLVPSSSASLRLLRRSSTPLLPLGLLRQARRQGIALVAGGGGSRGGGGGGRGNARQQGKVPTATQSGQLSQQQHHPGGDWPPAAAGSSSHHDGLVDAKADADRFFDILMLPSQSPMVSKREELKLAEIDEDKLFRRHVRTAKRYNLLIRAQAERMGLAPIERTFQNMLRHGIVPNVEIYTSMVVACAKNKDPQAAERYLTLMTEEGLEPNIWTYTALTQAYTRAGQLQDAFQVLERLKEASIRPNVVIYTSLIHGCLLADNVDKAWDTFDHMRQREAIEPDEVTFTLMITACAQKGQVERARNVMEEMQLLQLSPTEVTYNAQIEACAQRRDYYAEAFLNLERMKAAGFRPDEVTYSALLHASSRNGDVKMAEIVFKSMNDSGMLVAKPEATRFWNSLLSAYASAQPHADSLTRTTTIATAARIINTMKQIGQQADRYTANTLLSLYAHAHRIRSVEALFDAAFLPPRPLSAGPSSAAPVVMATAVDHSGQSPPGPVSESDGVGRHDDGGVLWTFGERFTPDVVTYTCLIQLYADTRRPEKALNVWQLMKESGVEPNMRTYEYMVRCLARSGYLNSSMKILREMREKGFLPSHHVVTLLMQRTQAYPELRDEVRRLTGLPVPVKVDEKSILALRLRRAGRSDHNPFAAPKRRQPPLHYPL